MARPREFETQDVVRKALFFWEKGYAATSLNDLEVATGVARMSLYNVFKDKERLFQAVLDSYIGATQRLYEKHLKQGGVAELEDLIAAYTKPHGSTDPWGCLMLNTITAAEGVSSTAREAIESFRRYALQQIEAALRRAADLGDIDGSLVSPDMADFILTTMWGAKAAIRHAGSTKAAAPVARTLSAMLRHLRLPQNDKDANRKAAPHAVPAPALPLFC